jgi:hypothetical protein
MLTWLKVTSRRNFHNTVRAAWQACSVTWDLGANSAFAPGTSKTAENLDRVGRSQDLPVRAHLYPAVRRLNTRALAAVPVCAAALLDTVYRRLLHIYTRTVCCWPMQQVGGCLRAGRPRYLHNNVHWSLLTTQELPQRETQRSIKTAVIFPQRTSDYLKANIGTSDVKSSWNTWRKSQHIVKVNMNFVYPGSKLHIIMYFCTKYACVCNFYNNK